MQPHIHLARPPAASTHRLLVLQDLILTVAGKSFAILLLPAEETQRHSVPGAGGVISAEDMAAFWAR